MTSQLSETTIKNYCLQSGFDTVGISRPTPTTWKKYAEWIKNEYHGEMHYLENRLPQRNNPSSVLHHSPGSIIVTAKNYYSVDPTHSDSLQPVVSRYAWGDDYHQTMTHKGRDICQWIEKNSHGDHYARWCVDSAPVLERDFAAQAGIGWVGKHTNILTTNLGNWIFLGVIITTIPLQPDKPIKPHCGTCTKCLHSCPTDAFISPYVLDARKCISYLTIELRGSIPREYRSLIGQRIFGCDDCLEVCPWNRFASAATDTEFYPRECIKTSDLIQLMNLTMDEFRIQFKNSPIKRAKYEGFKRNVAVALGNSKNPKALEALTNALNEESPLIREHAIWAIYQIGKSSVYSILENHLTEETDGNVINEIHKCLRELKTDKK